MSLIGLLPSLAGKEGRGGLICAMQKACNTAWKDKGYSPTSSCQLPLRGFSICTQPYVITQITAGEPFLTRTVPSLFSAQSAGPAWHNLQACQYNLLFRRAAVVVVPVKHYQVYSRLCSSSNFVWIRDDLINMIKEGYWLSTTINFFLPHSFLWVTLVLRFFTLKRYKMIVILLWRNFCFLKTIKNTELNTA